MHPNRSFAWTDEQDALAFLRQVSFSTIFIGAAESKVIHVPVIVAGPDRLRFHLSRANPARDLGGKRAFLSCLGPDAYVSPDWYGTPDQVPTWNYVAVEAEGPLRLLDEAELAEQLDHLAEEHEARLAPKTPWTRGKMSPGRFEAMVKAIDGYEMRIEALRGTRKLGQNKTSAEISGAISGLDAAGRSDVARLMRMAR